MPRPPFIARTLRTARRGAILAALVLSAGAMTAATAACKPHDEGRRMRAFDILGGPPSGALEGDARSVPPLELDPPADASSVPPLPVVRMGGALDAAPSDTQGPSAPDDAAGAETTVANADDARADARSAEGAALARDPVVDPALVAQLGTRADSAAQAKARDLNKSGLAHQRRRAFALAVADYEASLAAWPASPYARYNLACARAQMGDADAALRALAVLSYLAAREGSAAAGAADRLRAARADKDLEALRADPRFRRLTGATEIVVAWVPGADGAPAAKARAKEVADLLTQAKWPAKVPTVAWNRMRPARAVEVRADDPIAARAAAEVASVLGVAEVDARREWPADAPPIVVYLGGGEADGGTLEPEPEPDAEQDPNGTGTAGSATTLSDFVGRPLRATVNGAVETLELRATGYFTWQRAEPDDARRIRTGRWKTDGATLALSYKETRERAAPPGKKPRAEALGEHQETLAWSIHRGALVVGGASFHAGEP